MPLSTMDSVQQIKKKSVKEHFRQWIPSNKFMLQIKHHCHKPFELHSIIMATFELTTKKTFWNSHIVLVIKSNLFQREKPTYTRKGDDGCHPKCLVLLIFEQTALLL